MKKQNTISSQSLAYLKSLISPQVDVVDVTVKGKWLTALLSNGIYFSVLNNI